MANDIAMTQIFIPYAGKAPAAVDINGHRLVIVSQDPDELQSNLSMLGGDRLEMIQVLGSKAEEEELLEEIADSVDGGVVLAPTDIELAEVLRDLESELPWIH
jgi:hypothetical protein